LAVFATRHYNDTILVALATKGGAATRVASREVLAAARGAASRRGRNIRLLYLIRVEVRRWPVALTMHHRRCRHRRLRISRTVHRCLRQILQRRRITVRCDVRIIYDEGVDVVVRYYVRDNLLVFL